MSATNTIIENLANLIAPAIGQAFPEITMSESEVATMLTTPPNLDMGHFAFPCFPLAKTCKQAPPKIAQAIAEKVPENPLINKAFPAGPYLNFTLNGQAFAEGTIPSIIDGSVFSRKLVDKKLKKMFEYSQPNTHKDLHVGHMRNLCLGNALVRLQEYLGHNVIPTTYPGDVGTHVAKCLWYLKYHNEEDAPTDDKGTWLSKIYVAANSKLEDEKGTDKEDHNREQLTAILKELEAGSGEFYDLWRETREWSLALFHNVYDWADVKFDRWYYESEVDAPSLKFVKELFEQGKLIEDDGAIGMDLNEDKLGFCLLIKSDGNGLYATKDLALAVKKFEEYDIDENIYIVDKRQAHHFNQVFKVLEKIGFEKSKDCHHLQYDFVELPSGAMSSRKGVVIPLMELITKMESTITENYLEKYRGDWSDEDITTTSKIIANGAIKYGMLRMDNNRKIVFDMDEWLRLDGETGPYLQYVYARINSMCKKLGFDPSQSVDWSSISHKNELALLHKLCLFNDTAKLVAEQYKTSALCTYLYELGKLFNSFYAECSVGNAETPELKIARLALSKATGEVMRKGLELLGIQAPERM